MNDYKQLWQIEMARLQWWYHHPLSGILIALVLGGIYIWINRRNFE
jgi:cbb3-type cytochrome oxidase subunit 1